MVITIGKISTVCMLRNSSCSVAAFLCLQLCYYDSKRKEKCHGVISLTDEDSVEQADPQIVPGLKPSENGFFFNVSGLYGHSE